MWYILPVGGLYATYQPLQEPEKSIEDGWKAKLRNTLKKVHSLKLTASLHLKMDGWNTILSFWDGLFSGAMLVSGRYGAKL